MNIEIGKKEISEFLWLQNEIERILFSETLKRAIEKGFLPSETKYLFREHIDSEYGVITVSYTIPNKSARWNSDDIVTEEFTLSEALQLCLTGGSNGS